MLESSGIGKIDSPRLKIADFSGGPSLREVIDRHLRHASTGLPENVGDGYLVRTNRIFGNIRADFLASHFRFGLNESPEYFVFPLMSLDRILNTGMVPYRDNISWLHRLESEAPGCFTLRAVEAFELARNYLLHESAHFVAHHELSQIQLAPGERGEVFRMLAEEAFANTAETLSNLYADDEIGSYFLAMNSFVHLGAAEVADLLYLAREDGFGPLARLLFHSYLYSNFLFQGLGPSEATAVGQRAGISLEKPQACRVVEIALRLNARFRQETAALYLMKQRYSPDFFTTRENHPEQLLSLVEHRGMLGAMEHALDRLVRNCEGDFAWN